jgi:cell division GTPase FtsZ
MAEIIKHDVTDHRYRYGAAGTAPKIASAQQKPVLVQKPVVPIPVVAPTPIVVPIPVQPIAPAAVIPTVVNTPKQEPVTPPISAEIQEKLHAEAKAKKEAELKHEELKKSVSTLQQALKYPEFRAVKFGVAGIGQGGSRLAEQFYKFGYPAVVMNTAKQDLSHIKVPEENKVFMDYTLGGAAKDLALGQEATIQYAEQVAQLMHEKFTDVDMLLLAATTGGGTGSGGITTLVQIAHSLRDIGGIPIILLCTLPLEDEGAIVKSNAIKTLDKLATLVRDGVITSLIIVDNAKIQQKYPDVSAGQFWDVANFDIVNIFHTFNVLAACHSKYANLDPMDYTRVLSSGSCTILGKMVVPVYTEEGHIAMHEDELARALTSSIKSGLLAEGFDLKETVRAGIILTAREDILNQIPAININYAFNVLGETIGDAAVFRGIYADENKQDEITVYSMFSGIGLPRDRINAMLASAEEGMQHIEDKQADKSKMRVLDPSFTEQTQSVYDKMKQQSTPFGRMINRHKGRSSRTR